MSFVTQCCCRGKQQCGLSNTNTNSSSTTSGFCTSYLLTCLFVMRFVTQRRDQSERLYSLSNINSSTTPVFALFTSQPSFVMRPATKRRTQSELPEAQPFQYTTNTRFTTSAPQTQTSTHQNNTRKDLVAYDLKVSFYSQPHTTRRTPIGIFPPHPLLRHTYTTLTQPAYAVSPSSGLRAVMT